MVSYSLIISFILLLLGSITLFLAYWGYNRRRLYGAVEFSLFMLSMTLYTLGYAMEITHTDIRDVLFIIKIEYLGIPYMSYLGVVFTYKFITGMTLNRILKIVMLVIPVISTILVFTLEHHSLYYINPHIIDGGYFPVIDFGMGPFYIIRLIYQQLLSLLTVIFLVTRIKGADKFKKGNIIALIVAQIIPSLVLVFYIMDLVPGKIDINPFSTFFIGVIFSIAILKFRFFEITPVGRDLALDSVDESFILLDKNGVVMDYNNSAKHLKFIPLKIGVVLPSNNHFNLELSAAISKNLNTFEFICNDTCEGPRFYKVNIYKLKIYRKKSDGRVILINDVTDIMLLMDKLEYKATYDYLTNLRNRRAIIDSGLREIEISRRNITPLSFVMVDIDHFKQVNDTFGHKIGDAVLIMVSDLLKSGLRSIDLIGRYGGEEFLIICPNTSEKEAVLTFERLRESICSKNLKVEHIEINIACSFGIYTYRGEESTIEKLMDKADKALYKAKNNGRNQVCIEN